jgi:Ca2+-binding EF-hand superfamily protein
MNADANNDGKLDFREIKRLCNILNIDADEKMLRRMFTQFDTDQRYV